MNAKVESATLLGWIVQLCAQEEDIDLLDFIYQLLAKNANNEEVI